MTLHKLITDLLELSKTVSMSAPVRFIDAETDEEMSSVELSSFIGGDEDYERIDFMLSGRDTIV